MKNIKRSFTLIEVIISITLFSIIIIFLYSTLNITQRSNQVFKDELNKNIDKEDIKFIFFEDLINSKNKIKIYEDKDKNTILTFSTNNTFHNPFYTNITYLLGRKNNLLRIESNIKYDSKKIYQFKDNENRYIDKLVENIKLFRVYQDDKNKKKYTIYILYNNEKELIFTLNTL